MKKNDDYALNSKRKFEFENSQVGQVEFENQFDNEIDDNYTHLIINFH